MKLCSLLPMAAPAMVRDNGEIWLGLQVQHNFGDPARDLGAVLERRPERRARRRRPAPTLPARAPRLQDLVAGDPLDVTVHDGFGFWVADVPEADRARPPRPRWSRPTPPPTRPPG